MRATLVALFLVGSAAGAQQGGEKAKYHPLVDQMKVDKAIQEGIKFLRTAASPPGPHGIPDTDELKLLTFIHAGVPESDPDLQTLLKHCMEKELDHTYSVSLLAMCLEEIDRVKYQYRIAQCAQFLADNMRSNGHFSYGKRTIFVLDVPTITVRKSVATAAKKRYYEKLRKSGRLPPPGVKIKPPVVKRIKIRQKRRIEDANPRRGDNSNSQYAALGMRACHDAGIDFDRKLIVLARQWWLTSQHKVEQPAANAGGKPAVGPSVASGTKPIKGKPRGWCYNDGDPACARGGPAYGSMTAGAVGALCIFDYMLDKNWKKDKAVLDGLKWMEQNWSVTQNVGPSETSAGAPKAWILYYLYAVERVGMLYDTATIGPHDWYLDGARHLLKSQKKDGSWDETVGFGKKPYWDTCFAILFLKRATRRLDVATGGR